MYVRSAEMFAVPSVVGVKHVVVIESRDKSSHVGAIMVLARTQGAVSDRDGEEIFWIMFEDESPQKVWEVTHGWLAQHLVIAINRICKGLAA